MLLALSARSVCFATKIFPVMLLGLDSSFLLLTESERGLASMREGLAGGRGWATTAAEE
jgi:hypothetical protein